MKSANVLLPSKLIVTTRKTSISRISNASHYALSNGCLRRTTLGMFRPFDSMRYANPFTYGMCFRKSHHPRRAHEPRNRIHRNVLVHWLFGDVAASWRLSRDSTNHAPMLHTEPPLGHFQVAFFIMHFHSMLAVFLDSLYRLSASRNAKQTNFAAVEY